MKSRQKKKNRKKFLPILVDEFNLFMMNDDERMRAITDYRIYRERFAYCKKYKDLKRKKELYYHFPVAETFNNAMKKISTLARKGATLPTVTQHIDDFN